MLNPHENHPTYTQYFSQALDVDVRIQKAEPLQASTRQAPWRFDLELAGGVQSFVLRLDTRSSVLEYMVLKAIENVPIPTPRVYGLDESGVILGEPCFFMDLIEGDSLLPPLLAGEKWAEDLYIDSINRLHAIHIDQLGPAKAFIETETAEDVLNSAYQYLHTLEDPIAEKAYQRLKHTMPPLPPVCFSNGDLYPDNFLVRDKTLVGIIDFANSSFSDPLFEFLLAFFVHTELRGRGIKERFCAIKGIDPITLPWYHALEYFDTWRWVSKYDQPFAGYDQTRLKTAVRDWLEMLN